MIRLWDKILFAIQVNDKSFFLERKLKNTQERYLKLLEDYEVMREKMEGYNQGLKEITEKFEELNGNIEDFKRGLGGMLR